MDAEPKALRLSTILTIAFVLFGIIAGSFIFLFNTKTSRVTQELTGVELDAISTRLVAPSPRADAAALERIAKAMPTVLDSGGDGDRRAAGEDLLELGRVAVPPLLCAVHQAAIDPMGWRNEAAIMLLRRADDVLRRIRLALTPESPAEPFPRDGGDLQFRRRAKSWFAWWDAYEAQHPEPK